MKNTRRLIYTYVIFAIVLHGSQAWAGIDKGPWLTGVTKNAITVKWASQETEGFIEYGLTEQLGTQMASTVKEGIHQVNLSALETGKKYFYQVTSGGQTSALLSFATAPEDDTPFQFAVISDTQSLEPAHRGVIEALMMENPAFILNNGDLTEFPFLSSLWEKFWRVAGLVAGTTSYFPIMGNHDLFPGGREAMTAYFENPMNQGHVSRYAFQYGNTYFINLDIGLQYYEGSEQYKWTESQLAYAKSLPSVKHCIVRAHYSVFSCSAHGDDANVLAFRRAMVPLFQKYDIDLYFSGHDHNYQRSVVNGITYVVTGGAGGVLYNGSPEEWTVKFEKTHHYIHVGVNGTKIQVEAVRPDGSVIESFTIDHDYHGAVGDDDSADDDSGADDDVGDDDDDDDDDDNDTPSDDDQTGGLTDEDKKSDGCGV